MNKNDVIKSIQNIDVFNIAGIPGRRLQNKMGIELNTIINEAITAESSTIA